MADWEGMDPRKMVRMIQLGMEDEVIKSNWIWQCTNCERCTWACPMGIDFGEIITNARASVSRDETPGEIQKTAENHREMMNNMRLTEEDAVETFEWMADELKETIPDLELPIDKQGAEFFVTINSKQPQYYPMDLQSIYKIFHAAGVNWTISSKWWEGTNYAMFTGDFDIWEYTLREQVKRAEELGCTTMAYTECGHGLYATKAGYMRFNIDHKFQVDSVVTLYARWIKEGRFKLDPSKNDDCIVTIHDPCNAVRKAKLKGFHPIDDDARYVLNRIVNNYVEPDPSRDNNYCCSGGGGALINGFARARTYYGRVKVDQIMRTGATHVCTPCVNCFDGIGNLARDYKDEYKFEPVHLWTLLANAIVLDE